MPHGTRRPLRFSLCRGRKVEVSEGNPPDPQTMGRQIMQLRERCGLSKVVLAGDRGMLTEARINQEPKLAGSAMVRAYQRLSRVERAFRNLKTVDLKVRPVFHRSADRVHAHVLPCMLAYHVAWYMRRKLAPLLFDDEDADATAAAGASVVAPDRVPAAVQRRRPARAGIPLTARSPRHRHRKPHGAPGCPDPRPSTS